MKQAVQADIFKNTPDAFAYLVISAIIPVTYIIADFITLSSGDTVTMIVASLTLLSFFASCAYDYVSRYNDDSEIRKPFVCNVLYIGKVLYMAISVGTLICMILVVTDTVNIDNLRLVYIAFFVAGLYAPFVSLVEVGRLSWKTHKKKLARAKGV